MDIRYLSGSPLRPRTNIFNTCRGTFLTQRTWPAALQHSHTAKPCSGLPSANRGFAGAVHPLFGLEPPRRRLSRVLLGSLAARHSGTDRSQRCFCRNRHATEGFRAGTDSPLESTVVEKHSAGHVGSSLSQVTRGNPRRTSRRCSLQHAADRGDGKLSTSGQTTVRFHHGCCQGCPQPQTCCQTHSAKPTTL